MAKPQTSNGKNGNGKNDKAAKPVAAKAPADAPQPEAQAAAPAAAPQPKRQGRPPYKSAEEKAETEAKRKAHLAGLNPKGMALYKLDAYARLTEAMTEKTLARCGSAVIPGKDGSPDRTVTGQEVVEAIEDAVSFAYDFLGALPEDFAFQRKPRGTAAVSFEVGELVNFRPIVADKWASRFGTSAVAIDDVDNETKLAFLPLSNGRLVGVPFGHLMRAKADQPTA